jgi:hypothetical protein
MMVPKGIEHLSEAGEIAGALGAENADLKDRFAAVAAKLALLSEAPLARSGLAVPLTAPINRNAKNLKTLDGEKLEQGLTTFETAVANFEKRAGGAGNIAIT